MKKNNKIIKKALKIKHQKKGTSAMILYKYIFYIFLHKTILL